MVTQIWSHIFSLILRSVQNFELVGIGWVGLYPIISQSSCLNSGFSSATDFRRFFLNIIDHNQMLRAPGHIPKHGRWPKAGPTAWRRQAFETQDFPSQFSQSWPQPALSAKQCCFAWILSPISYLLGIPTCLKLQTKMMCFIFAASS